MNRPLHIFTVSFCELLQNEISVKSALAFLTEQKTLPKKVRYACKELALFLQEGFPFSKSLQLCTNIYFDELYVAFVSGAENGASLKEIFNFLKKRQDERQKVFQVFVTALMYPVIVVFLSVIGAFVLLKQSYLFGMTATSSFYNSIVQATIFLFLGSAILIFLEFIFLFGDCRYDVFSLIYFLLKENISLYQSLKISLLVLTFHPFFKRKIVETLTQVEKGLPASAALCNLGKNYSIAFSLLNKTGNSIVTLKTIVSELFEKNQERQKRVLLLLEPMSMILLSAYMVFLIKQIVLPVLFTFTI